MKEDSTKMYVYASVAYVTKQFNSLMSSAQHQGQQFDSAMLENLQLNEQMHAS